jgi:uncharacterized RDD family membrane protein YckC
MENIYLQTSQNIHIEQSVASIGERIVAQLIDYLLIGIYSLFVAILYSISSDLFRSDAFLVPLFLFLPVVFYDLICEMFFNGQNVGKRVMKLKVVTVNGSQPTFGAYFIRWMFRLIDITISVGSIATLTIILNGKGCRLGDIAAGTRVIRLKPLVNHSLGRYKKLPANYQPTFRESENLSDKDYALIKEILEFKMKNGYTAPVVELMEKARVKYAEKLNIASDLTYRDFLSALEMDYIYYNSTKPNGNGTL